MTDQSIEDLILAIQDLRKATAILIDNQEYLIIFDKKRIGDKDTKRMLHDTDLAHALLEDDYKNV